MVSTARVIPPVLEPLRRYSQRALQPVIRIGHMFAFFVRAVMGVPIHPTVNRGGSGAVTGNAVLSTAL